MAMTWTDEQIKEAARAFEDFDPADAKIIDVSDLRAIAEAADAVRRDEDAMRRDEAKLTERVAVARARGRSWTWIATALGVSRQAARQRFKDKVGS
jgi:hypothetical protein